MFNPKYQFYFLMLLLILVQGCTNVADKTYPESDPSYPLITIHEINQNKEAFGNYNIEGYVVQLFDIGRCPSCPNKLECESCFPDNIIVSEKNEKFEIYSLFTSYEILIFSKNSKQFEVGKKYRFSIKNLENKPTTENLSISMVELIGYEEL